MHNKFPYTVLWKGQGKARQGKAFRIGFISQVSEFGYTAVLCRAKHNLLEI